MAIHRYSLNRMIFVPCFVVLLQTAGFSQPAVWNNPGTGPAAGNWSSASNWSPAGVPTSANSAQIRNGGEARITNSIAASRIEVGKNGGVGKFTSVSSGIEILVDSDFEIGEIGGSFATGPVVVTSSGSASISNATQLLVGNSGSGDLDIGQTNATSGAQANGLGSLTLDAITLVEVLDDVDVGQAGGSAIANANGTLLVSSVGDFRIGADLDVGQSGGTGQSAAFGLATFENSQVTMGADADVGRTTGSVGGNSGDGTLSATDSTLSIGFADALLPGSLNIGDASTLQFQRATALGGVTFERTTLAVADRINIGGISGGGTNSLTSARGSLTLIDSFAAASIVDVAVVADNTAGTATGRLKLDASLLTVGGMLGLGTGATLSFEISGTTRANGTVATDQYGAINALSATLAGNLEILLAGGFTPTAGDQFDLISTTGMLTQSFSTSSLPSLSTGLSWNLTGKFTSARSSQRVV